MKALRLVVGLNMLMFFMGCGGVADETGTTALAVSSDEAGLAVGARLACAVATPINGQLAAMYCCRAGNEPSGDNPTSSCVSDWCVVQCQEDCGGNDACYDVCYGTCRNAITCECP